jgi:hypothetical protein
MKRFWVMGMLLLLVTCSAKRPVLPTVWIPTDTLQATSSRLPTFTLTFLPTFTTTPTDTPLPTPTMLVLTPGLKIVENSRIPGYVFQMDPQEWNLVVTDAGYEFLVYKTNPECMLRVTPAMGLGTPEKFYVKQLGDRLWTVYDNTSAALYKLHPANAFYKKMKGSSSLFLTLRGTDNPVCRQDLETLLANMADADLAYIGSIPTPFATTTPRPPLEGYNCNSLSPRLRVGDFAYIIGDGIWLRSEPRRTVETQSRLLPKFGPYQTEITDGPVCADDHTFWHVNIYQIGEGGETSSGWMAEANPTEYLLEILP